MLSKISFLIFLVLIAFTGCSNLLESTRKSLVGTDTPRKTKNKESKWVSKAQYNDLLAKYKNLNEKYTSLKDEMKAKPSSFGQANELASSETIDVFGKEGLAGKSTVAIEKKQEFSDKDFELYQRAVALFNNGKTEEALRIFQYLENAAMDQIKVRSKYYIGEVYLKKSQFDLALQVYEQIIRSYSFSGRVMKAIERAALCSTKLNLKEKKDKYESLLKDVFEVRS